jgi:probable rRNA maturation factor
MTAAEITWASCGDAPVDDAAITAAVAAALEHGGRPGTLLAVVLVDDATLAELHREHLDDPSATDVITFDLGDEAPGPAGELYVSVERARTVADRRGVSPARELVLYVVHGVLHLCGYDDASEEERVRMRAAEAAVMARLGYEPDDAEHELGAEQE